jgi:hypothetical protein
VHRAALSHPIAARTIQDVGAAPQLLRGDIKPLAVGTRWAEWAFDIPGVPVDSGGSP